MEFWGVEVKAGKNLRVRPGTDRLLHISQASLGEAKKKGKGNESVPLFLKVDDQNLVIGILSSEKCSQITFDLVFEKEFELSHNWKNGSVYFCGYKSVNTEGYPYGSDSGSEEENEIPEQKDAPSNPPTGNAKSRVKVVEPIKEEDTESDSDEDDSDKDESDDVKDVKEMADSSDDDSSDDEDEDDSSEEEDEATPKKAEQNKKRPALVESDTKNPTGKKAKLVTPQKTGGEGKKTGVHIATPYPKQAGKTPANNDKSKQQTPASDGQVTCGSCSRSFKSNQALESHSKAKHEAAK